MFQLINDIVTQFIKNFKRPKTWQWFVCIILGFIVRNDQRGVTSTISALRLKPKLYHTILHFFRSQAYKVSELYKKWVEVVMKYATVSEVRGKLVLLGDHIKVAKEGRRMPCVQVHHQSSENSGKAEYIEGHIFGQISAVITDGETSRAIALTSELQESAVKTGGDTLISQTVKLAGEVTKSAEKSAILVLDAYFCSGTTFAASDTITDGEDNRQLEIVTRSKTNTIAFRDAAQNDKPKCGRPRKYGEKVKLYDLFDDRTVSFESAKMILYGKAKEVAYLCRDLFWKPAGRKIRFVLVKIGSSKLVLMSSDLELPASDIITLYSNRFKIETGFDDQKNDMGGFAYHFWTDALPKRKRNKDTVVSDDPNKQEKVNKTKQAIHSWVCLNIIATGILSIIGFSYNRVIWNHYPGFIKTVRSRIPSVATTKLAFSHLFSDLLPALGSLKAFAFVPILQRAVDFFYFAA
jgi:hypothetical protein